MQPGFPGDGLPAFAPIRGPAGPLPETARLTSPPRQSSTRNQGRTGLSPNGSVQGCRCSRRDRRSRALDRSRSCRKHPTVGPWPDQRRDHHPVRQGVRLVPSRRGTCRGLGRREFLQAFFKLLIGEPVPGVPDVLGAAVLSGDPVARERDANAAICLFCGGTDLLRAMLEDIHATATIDTPSLPPRSRRPPGTAGRASVQVPARHAPEHRLPAPPSVGTFAFPNFSPFAGNPPASPSEPAPPG